MMRWRSLVTAGLLGIMQRASTACVVSGGGGGDDADRVTSGLFASPLDPYLRPSARRPRPLYGPLSGFCDGSNFPAALAEVRSTDDDSPLY